MLTPVQWVWQALKRGPANLSSSVSSLLCSSSEKMLFIWPKPFAVPFALWGAYWPWDNSKGPSASFLFIKSFLGFLFKSASICVLGKTMEGNVKRPVYMWMGVGIISQFESLCCFLWVNFFWRSCLDHWWIGSRLVVSDSFSPASAVIWSALLMLIKWWQTLKGCLWPTWAVLPLICCGRPDHFLQLKLRL